ncbi:MAG: baseplate protein, partial [Dehalococcoidia bacterium]|nr:baseplate protein [Dehalococcoidia bacterium]
MSLPVINTPTYELEVPSTKETLKYRPFLVKEEKILLMAMEEEDQKHMVNAVRTIVDNCTFKTLEIKKMPMFDLEYVFLNIRAKSVGEVASVKVLCDDDGETYAEVDIPLDKIQVKFQKDHTNLINLTDDIKIEMAYPTFEMLDGFDENDTNGIFDLIGK